MAGSDHVWSQIERTDGCWFWTGCLDKDGYGVVGIDGRQWRVHRWVYEHLVGTIPDELVLDHLCRVRHCANPDHLEPVTDATNVLRGYGPPALNARKTECDRGHSLEEHAVIRRGRRVCRLCYDEAHRTYERDRYRADRETGAERARDYRRRNRELVNARARERRARARAERGDSRASSPVGSGQRAG